MQLGMLEQSKVSKVLEVCEVVLIVELFWVKVIHS